MGRSAVVESLENLCEVAVIEQTGEHCVMLSTPGSRTMRPSEQQK